MVVADGRKKEEHYSPVEVMQNMVVDLRWYLELGTDCDRKEMQYAARRDVAAAVLDP